MDLFARQGAVQAVLGNPRNVGVARVFGQDMRLHRDTFRGYLESVPDDLLKCVVEDYLWLEWHFHGEPQAAEFRRRSDCCRDECRRRGLRAKCGEAGSINLQPA